MASGIDVGQVIAGGIIAVVVGVVGAVIAYLLGQNGAATATAFKSINDKLTEHGKEQTEQGKSLATLTSSLGPAVVELELHSVEIAGLSRDMAVLKEWRTIHEKWAGEAIARLDGALSARRSTDTA